MDNQTIEYVNKKFYNLISRIEQMPASFAGECSLPPIVECIRDMVNAIYFIFGIEIDFEVEFQQYVLDYYGKHYSIDTKVWTDRKWDEIICFFHFYRENALSEFFTIFREYINHFGIENEVVAEKRKLIECNVQELIKKYIDSVEKSPEKYMAEISLKRFFSSLKSIEYIIYDFCGEEYPDALDGFLEYVCIFYSDKYKIQNTSFFNVRNWDTIISFFSSDDKEAFYTFFALYKKFIFEKNEKDFKKIWQQKLFSC